MIVDVTGIPLLPGDGGAYCPGNGLQQDALGHPIECCCEECAYYQCCLETHQKAECDTCFDEDCPHAKGFLCYGGNKTPCP